MAFVAFFIGRLFEVLKKFMTEILGHSMELKKDSMTAVFIEHYHKKLSLLALLTGMVFIMAVFGVTQGAYEL